MESQATVKIVVENTESQVRRLVLEPWGGEYGTSFESKGAMMSA